MKENIRQIKIFEELKSLNKKHPVVVFSGAGMSAESGISTFRGSGGLWEKHDINDVATPEAWQRHPRKVLDFYNARRKQLLEVEPNPAHRAIAELEQYLPVKVITQNIDDLHERAGSSEVLHLHGELRKAESSVDKSRVYNIEGWELNMGMKCERGSQLRPHVVWFGEMVPMMEPAQEIIQQAGLIVVIGTSLNVYPAAGLVTWAPADTLKLVIDPAPVSLQGLNNADQLLLSASQGVAQFLDLIKQRP